MRELHYTLHRHALEQPARLLDTPARLERALAVLEPIERAQRVVEAGPASFAALAQVHQDDYLRGLARLSLLGGEWRLGPDVVVDQLSWPAVRAGAGALLGEVARALTDPGPLRICLNRPGSHHAEPALALGMCLVNNLAVAAAHALALGAARVAIVDFDAHHGNGTQQIFWEDARVFTVSMHQFPFFPGSGAADELGSGPGRGYNLNLPLAAGARGAEVLESYERALTELERFRPELLLYEAGLDAHHRDPSSELRFGIEEFSAIGRLSGELERALGVPSVLELGGGYAAAPISEGLPALLSGWGIQ